MKYRKYTETTEGGKVTATRRGYGGVRIVVEPKLALAVYQAEDLMNGVARAIAAVKS